MAISPLPPLLLFFFFILSQSASDRPHTFIVHVSQSHKPAVFSAAHDWYHHLLKTLPPSPHSPKLLYSYSKSIRGFSARLTSDQAASLLRASAVISVVPDQIRRLHTTRTPHFLGLSPGSGLWPESTYGDDVIIGVLDTGIWPELPSFSDSGFSDVSPNWKGTCQTSSNFNASCCNKKLIGARAYYQGFKAHMESNSKLTDESSDSLSPRDTEGHGSHTASTAGGNSVKNAGFFDYAKGEARGMASKARIAAYKICWSVGCFDSDILAAMDQAITDGVHIISLSVGATGYAPQYYRDSIAIGAFGATQHGIIVSCSAGNSGPGPYTAVNIAPWILTVGASTIDREFPADVALGDGRVFGGVSLYSGEPLGDEKISLVYGGDVGDRYCYPGRLDSARVGGKIVICDRGGNARVEKGSAVKQAGGVGMIMANTKESGEELIADSHLVPATMVGASAADEIRRYVNSSRNPTATIVFRGTVIGPSPPAPQVASFSSRGPNHLTAEILKPDVIAPGVNILAGWSGAAAPTDLSIDPRRVQFNIISGTSMSCPHVSGIAALLRRAYPGWSPAAIKSSLITTAYNLDNSGGTILDLASGKESTPFVRGAGHVDPNSALDPGLVYDIDTSDYVSFLCSIGYDSRIISVFLKEPVDTKICDTKLSTPGDLNYPSFAVVFKGNSTSVKYTRFVTNVGRESNAVYEVKVNAPENVDVKVSPSRLVFSKENRKLKYEITFTSGSISGLSSGGSYGFGSIEWGDGSHRVRSPIAITWERQVSVASY